ncbi:hypothetical protein [Yoonia maritima]|uniref:hypothetical protein n=1 Tax=Yoonia maritima TaxID=1435347 RepID=UPI0037359EC7
MTRSANDDFADTLHPTPTDHRPKITDFLSKVPSTPTGPDTSLSMPELFTFASRYMTLHGSIVFWKQSGDPVSQRHTADVEAMLSFRFRGQTHLLRHADVAWMLCHERPIPEGHVVKYSGGDITNRDRHNLWLVDYT